jgi:integrase
MKPDPNKRQEVADAVAPGLYLVVQPSGAKSWALRYRHHGTPRKLTLGSYPAVDVATSRELAREALKTVALGRDPAGEKKEARAAERDGSADRDLVRSRVADFIERRVKAKNKPRTAEETERLFRLHVLPEWGEHKVQSITRKDVSALLDGVADGGAPVAANRVLAALSTFFNWLVDRGDLDASPCTRMAKPTAETSRERVLTDDELRLAWLAAEVMGYPMGTFVQVVMLTAQRRDEVAKMTRAEINRAGDLWTLPAARSKNKLPHEIPLSTAAQAILASAPRIASKSGFVFTTTGETAISGYANAKERLDREMLALARRGAEEQGNDPGKVKLAPWRLQQDVRRTASTIMHDRLGVAPHIVEAVLNHVSGHKAGVAGTYNRALYRDEKRAALEAWSRFILVLTNKEAA